MLAGSLTCPPLDTQLSHREGHNMIQLEHDYQGADFNLNFKALNPGPTDLTGVYIGTYLQSITKNLALGFESLYQRPAPSLSEMHTSMVAKYTSNAKDWIATAQLQPAAGILQATYWHRLSEKVDFAADLQMLAAPASRRSAVATVGAKYELRMATFRAQLDSTGKVSALLEQRFAPSLSFLFAGEIDHFKVCDASSHVTADTLTRVSPRQNAAKVGVGVMIESTTLTPEEMAQMAPPPGV